MFEGFVNPALVAGTALAAVPLLIHLLNRQRHRPLQWAATRFVVAAYRKTRRRVQLENLLLLLLRMAAVALLALAVSRPFAAGDGVLGNLTERRRDVILVVDGSASTGYREEVETIFERILERANELIAGLDGGGGDRVQVILAGARPRLFGWTDPEQALSLLSTLNSPTDEVLDLTAVLGEVVDMVREDAAGTGRSTLEVRLLTDLQRNVFEQLLGAPETPPGTAAQPEGGRDTPLLLELLDTLLAFEVKLVVEDLGPALQRPPNLSVSAVGPLDPILAPGDRVGIRVQITNHGSAPRPAERVTLTVDGNKLPVQRIDVPAQGTAEAIFAIALEDSGAHTLVGALDGDRLALDDRRSSVVIVPEPIRVLVVNGKQSDDIREDEVGYLLLALEPLSSDGPPGSDFVSPFAISEQTPDVLVSADLDLRNYDIILLANVASLPRVAIERIEQRVATGASLILSMGDRIADLASYNQKLFRPDGTGLLPAELVGHVAAARRESYYRVAAFDESSPILGFFADETWKPLLTEVPIYEFEQARPLPDAIVLASLDDDGRSPLLIERAWDQGRVFLWTTGFSTAWTDIPASPKTLIPLAHEWLRYAGARHEPARVVAPGEPVRLVVAAFRHSLELVRADQSRRSLDGDATELPDGRWRLPEVHGAETERVGLYVIQSQGDRDEPFAVQLDPRESDLARLDAGEAAGLHSAIRVLTAGEREGRTAEEGPRRGEIWRFLALATLLALIGESLWGAWIGQRRRVPA
ncbi:MAG: BatA domain-containing protein [Planctomycetota bacterium]